jgi:hypothetical protein
VVLGDVQRVDADAVVGLRQPQPVLVELRERRAARVEVIENAELQNAA